tara:strand:+ start:1157 stop:1444 length:288 start_codon:yes stop_codon:yes gene_type:complete
MSEGIDDFIDEPHQKNSAIKPREKRLNTTIKNPELDGLDRLKQKLRDENILTEDDEITLSNLLRIACRVAHSATSFKEASKDVLENIQRGKKGNY